MQRACLSVKSIPTNNAYGVIYPIF